VLNRSTSRITPQFHVVYDVFFQTVKSIDDNNDVDLNTFDWIRFIQLVGTSHVLDSEDPDIIRLPPLDREWEPPPSPVPPDTNVQLDDAPLQVLPPSARDQILSPPSLPTPIHSIPSPENSPYPLLPPDSSDDCSVPIDREWSSSGGISLHNAFAVPIVSFDSTRSTSATTSAPYRPLTNSKDTISTPSYLLQPT